MASIIDTFKSTATYTQCEVLITKNIPTPSIESSSQQPLIQSGSASWSCLCHYSKYFLVPKALSFKGGSAHPGNYNALCK